MEEYHNVKAQLDAMEYGKEFLALESLPLVKRLLSDLILTTESHEEQQKRIVELEAVSEKAQEECFPLRRENSRLVRENNQLHLELIKRAEEFDTQERKWKLSLKKGEDSVKDSAFASKQLVNKLSHLMRDLEANSDKENNMKNDRDGLQLIVSDINKTLKSMRNGPTKTGKSDINAEKNIKQLQEQLDSVTKQLQLRDEEIQRLGRQLEEGKHLTGLNGGTSPTGAGAGKDSRVIAQLNEQVRFLTAQVADYEGKLANTKVDARLLVQAQRELRRKDAKIKAMVLERSADQSKFVEFVGTPKKGELVSEDSQRFANLLESYRTDKAKMKQTIQELEMELLQCRGEYHTVKSKADSANKMSTVVSEEMKALKDKLREREEDLKDTQGALNALQSEKVQFMEDNSTAKAKLESQKLLLTENAMELDSLREELDKTKRDHRQLLTKSLKMKSDHDRLQELQQQQTVAERSFEIKLEEIREERNMLQTRINRFVDDNQKLANRLRQKQAELEEYKSSNEKEAGRARSLQDEVKVLQERLSQKSEAYKKEAVSRANLEKLSDLPVVVRELEAQLTELRERSASLDTELRRTTNNLKLEKARSDELGREVKNLEEKLSEMRSERGKSHEQIMGFKFDDV